MGESEPGVGVGKARESESGVVAGNSVNRLPKPDCQENSGFLTLLMVSSVDFVFLSLLKGCSFSPKK